MMSSMKGIYLPILGDNWGQQLNRILFGSCLDSPDQQLKSINLLGTRVFGKELSLPGSILQWLFQSSSLLFNLLTLSFRFPHLPPPSVSLFPLHSICHSLFLAIAKFSDWWSLGRSCWGNSSLASLLVSTVTCCLPYGEVGTQGSKPDAPCQTVTEVKAGDELGKGTHASPHSAFNDPCGTTAAWGVPKLNTRRLLSCPDTTLSPDHLSKTRETGVHHGVEEGCAFLTPLCVSLSSRITTQGTEKTGKHSVYEWINLIPPASRASFLQQKRVAMIRNGNF